MIVMKFGGSSLSSAEALARVADIIVAHAAPPGRRPVVVVSAMGKTTDRLLGIAETAVAGNGEEAARRLDGLRAYLAAEAEPVVPEASRPALAAFLDREFGELTELVGGLVALGELTPRSIDTIVSYGERMSSVVMTRALQQRGLDAAHVDAREVIVTDDRFTKASPILEATNERLNTVVRPLVDQGQVVVLGGFIARTSDGRSSTLGRGGSDFTASIVGAGLGAEEIQIWTDVDGIMTADPSMVPGARRLRVLSFTEASELAYFGARVLHPSTVLPAVERNIPVRVLHAQKPNVEGTLIVSEGPSSRATVKSIAYKEGITVIDIRSMRMLMAHGFLAKIFEVFDLYETAVDMVTTSEVGVSLTIDRTDRLDRITVALREFAEVSHTSGQVIVCLVGDNIRHTPGMAGKIFTAVEGISIRMISQGASRVNVSFVIDEKDLQTAVEALHETFFSQVNEEVFA